MKAALAGLNSIAGVVGVAVFDATDRCVTHSLPAPYEPILLQSTLQQVRVALTALGSINGSAPWNDVLLECEGGAVWFRSASPLLLMVLTTSGANLSMVGVATNVALLKLAGAAASAPGGETASAGGHSHPDAGGRSRTELLHPAVTDRIVRALARTLGPIARLQVEDEIDRLAQATPPGGALRARDVILGLTGRLSDAQKKKEFLAELEDLSTAR